MDSKQYWKYVDTKKDELIAWIKQVKTEKKLEESGQPDNHSIYITSRGDVLDGSREGIVSAANYRVAAKCIIDKTHQVSTAEEIYQHLTDEHNRLIETRKMDLRAKEQVFVSLTPEQLSVSAPPPPERKAPVRPPVSAAK
jgi:hypothetical protein